MSTNDDAIKNIKQNIEYIKQQNNIVQTQLGDTKNSAQLDSQRYYYLSNSRIYFVYVKAILQLLYFILFVILIVKLAFGDKPKMVKVVIIAAFFILPFLFKYLIPVFQWIWNTFSNTMNVFLGRLPPNMN